MARDRPASEQAAGQRLVCVARRTNTATDHMPTVRKSASPPAGVAARTFRRDVFRHRRLLPDRRLAIPGSQT